MGGRAEVSAHEETARGGKTRIEARQAGGGGRAVTHLAFGSNCTAAKPERPHPTKDHTARCVGVTSRAQHGVARPTLVRMVIMAVERSVGTATSRTKVSGRSERENRRGSRWIRP